MSKLAAIKKAIRGIPEAEFIGACKDHIPGCIIDRRVPGESSDAVEVFKGAPYPEYMIANLKPNGDAYVWHGKGLQEKSFDWNTDRFKALLEKHYPLKSYGPYYSEYYKARPDKMEESYPVYPYIIRTKNPSVR